MNSRLVGLQRLGEKCLDIYFSSTNPNQRFKKYEEAVQWFLEKIEDGGETND